MNEPRDQTTSERPRCLIPYWCGEEFCDCDPDDVANIGSDLIAEFGHDPRAE